MPLKHDRYDGIVATATQGGSDALWEMRFVVTAITPRIRELRGFGHDERSAALDLVRQLRFYADWIARRHDIPVIGDGVALRDSIRLRNGVDDSEEQGGTRETLQCPQCGFDYNVDWASSESDRLVPDHYAITLEVAVEGHHPQTCLASRGVGVKPYSSEELRRQLKEYTQRNPRWRLP